MINHHSCELFFTDLEVPAENLLGEEGRGFKVILDGMNAERILIAAECVGDGRYFIDKAVAYANERIVFGRPIGQNQGVQFPIARCHTEIEAAALMVDKAARLFDAGADCGAEANIAKLLAVGSVLARGRRGHADAWRVRIRAGISHRAQVPRDAPLSDCTDLDEPDPELRRRACARHAAVVLTWNKSPTRRFAGCSSSRSNKQSLRRWPRVASPMPARA